ncbi:MAG: hypothetical protein KDA58_02105, partial [Planctomycetaceae bacterium]|nr:hypothetical protein [Planctomycetaceae bacterium]
PRLEQLAHTDLPAARMRLTQDLLDKTLRQTADLNPVRTGRCRAAWLKAREHMTFTESPDSTSAAATNAVPYVTHLEYGTSRMRPFAMLRRALAQVRQHVSRLFRLP